MDRLGVDSFSWSRWRKCDIFSKFNFACRKSSIIRMRNIIKRYAVGYIKADELRCRCKYGEYAVMFLVDGEFQWCHLKKDEFKIIFK